MKTALKRFAAIAALCATCNLALANTGPGPRTVASTPRVIATATALSPQEAARYQHKATQTTPATHRQTAGASDHRAVWVVVGLVAVAGVVALVASGGGGGGGGGGY